MIPAIAAVLPVADGAGSAGSAASSAEAGLAFGNAVKNVGRDQADRQDAKQGRSSETKTGEAETGARTEGKRGRSATGEKEKGEADTDVSAADILGKLFGTAAPREIKVEDGEGQAKGEGHEPDDGLQERLVISTVADLAGAVEAGEAPKGQVSLRVLKMETHFEPRIDGATLVDPEKAGSAIGDVAKALAEDMPAKDAVESGRPVRKGFEEILQGLGRPSGETDAQSDGEGEAHGGNGRGETRSEAVKAAGKSAAIESGRVFGSASSAKDAAEPVPTTGQMISTQVAGRIAEAFGSERSAASNAPATSDAQASQLLRMTAGGAAMKTLSIQLQPQDLGRLDVSLKLVDGRLSVELAASEPSTAQALAGDRHTLRKLLEHAGFALDDAAITIVTKDVGQTVQTTSSDGASGEMRQGGSEGGQQRFAERGGSGGEGSASGERRRGPSAEDQADNRPARAAGNVFL